MHDPATTFYSPVTSPPREGWLAPPRSATRVVRDPIACAQQNIASEFDAQRRRIQELESDLAQYAAGPRGSLQKQTAVACDDGGISTSVHAQLAGPGFTFCIIDGLATGLIEGVDE
ncbi:hypothetical protein LTR91_001402 [Friedmanniomyces endolithicus]|uniref:Uncharacterized protein n=1 Tax=Friedmanniomyces endolithicus TaxID=329885 RepID=A0AAN6R1Z8_9PEZI|nr:hypothetical protein LTR94_002071 [Friedmanniomyces endolithicus]KAK0796599.1 hypothetical protein LTR59_007080 [Friedmanniomyces endolithicus]KAK0819784.1 hypothetical protein LTR38_000538 [Friedmanniomyces endolithicus]KAK0821975.1 hypothetical protein LTR75_000109 [Friedmanniomyces endolithicus]KAK0845933.1 hypothetical protein LTR03_007139 [Friedmanniomyces endolithicus]